MRQIWGQVWQLQQPTAWSGPPGKMVRRRTSIQVIKREVKEVDLYSTFIVVPHNQATQVQITQFYLQITPYLPLPRKRSPDGASPNWGCGHQIAAYYSFIYPDRIKGWVGLVGCPTADGLPTSGYPSAAGRAQDKESSPVRDRRSTTVPRNQR